MTQYLFRGKKISDKSWIEGSLILWPNGRAEIAVHGAKPGSLVKYAVIPETVGQWSGLYDIAKVKIFEGDIIKLTEMKYQYKVVFEEGQYDCYHVKNDYGKWGPLKRMFDMDIKKYEPMVAGNIHDNPELLNQTQQ